MHLTMGLAKQKLKLPSLAGDVSFTLELDRSYLLREKIKPVAS